MHTFTNDLDLQGDQFYFDGGEFTGLIQDQLNWIGGTAVDLTIAAGSQLVLTDSSQQIRTWAGEIVNRSRLEYKNEERNGENYPGYVVFGTSSKAARFINENEFLLIGKYASLTSSTGFNYDGSWERRGQQQLINKGVFRRSGSGTSYIDIPFLNQGQVEVKEGELYIYGDANNFINQGLVNVQAGRLSITNTHSHTGTYIARTGEVRFSGGVHTFTNDLDLQGDQFYFDGGEFTGLIQDQLNWIGGTAVDLTIAAGSQLVLTDSSPNFRTWSGEIVNHSQLEYRNDELAGYYYAAPVVFGTRDKAAKFINENAFALIGKHASLTSNYGSDNSWERRGQQQFINKGLFSRSGSGTSYIEIPFLNQGRLEVKEGDLSISGDDNLFTNEGLVDVQAGRLSITNTHSHTGTYIARTGEVRFSGGVHTFTNDLDLQGDQFYFDGGEFTGLIQDQLNWIGGTAVDLTIAAGSQLVLTDSSQQIRTWAGEIVNRSRLEYKNEERNGDYPGYVVFGTSSKAAKFINEHEFALIGKYASLTSNHGLGGYDTSGRRTGQQQFINKGLFSRSGSGTSNIDISFLNLGTFIADTGGTYISGQDYVQMLGETLVRRDASITLDGNRIYQLLGGSFGGDGSLYGKLFNQSVVNPGESIGALFLNGDYEQSDDGKIVIEIAGNEANARDSLMIRDHAKLNGIIELDFMNGFMPSIGDSFEIIRYGSLEGHLSLKSPLQNRSVGHKLSYRGDRLLFSVVNAEILGIPEAGKILSAPAGYISSIAINLPGYLWQSSLDGTAWTQVGSDSSSYLVAPADQGKQLRLVVSYTNEQGFLESVTMAAGTVPFVNDGPASFSITGTPSIGNTLVASTSSPDPDGNGTFSYTWQSSTNGTTWLTVGRQSSLLITTALAGRQLRLMVAYQDGQGFDESVNVPYGLVPLPAGAPQQSVVITTLRDNLGILQGTIAEGDISNDATPTLTGTLSAALGSSETLRVYRNGATAGTATVSGLNWSYTPTTALSGNGIHSFTAAVVKGSGLSGQVSDPRSMVLDATAPTQTVTISGVSDNSDPVQGAIAAGGRTNDTTPTISGNLSAPLGEGETLKLYNGNTFLVDALVDSTTLTWTATPTLAANGTYTLRARVQDQAGNQGRLSAGRTLILDTVAPAQTVTISGLSDNVGITQGPIAEGGTTNDTTPTLSGTLSAALGTSEVLRVYRDGVLAGNATVNATTWAWSHTFATPLSANGAYVFTAAVVDGAGNSGTSSVARSMVLDATAPTQTVTISGVSDNSDPVQGAIAAGGRTNDTTPTISGNLSAPLGEGETLKLYNGNTFLVDALVDSTTLTWTATPTLAANGTYTLRARVQDQAGNQGRLSAGRTLILDTVAPAQTVTISGLSDNVGITQGPIAEGGTTNDTTPTLSGTLSAALGTSEVLRVYRDGVLAGNATVNATTWAWSHTFATPLSANGAYVFTAAVVDGAGNSGTSSVARSMVLDATAPTQTVTISSVIDNRDPVQGAIAAGGRTNDTTPTISGSLSAAPGTAEVLRVYRDGVTAGNAKVNSTNLTWSYTPATPLNANGTYAFTAAVVDGAGNVGALTATRLMVLDAPISTAQQDTLTGTSDGDFFLLPQLSWSLLGTSVDTTYDTITGFQSTDLIQLRGRTFNTRLIGSAGVVTSLSAAEIATRLTPAWAANSARAFTAIGYAGTFVALNDAQAGYQAESDAILFLEGYSVSSTNGIGLV